MSTTQFYMRLGVFNYGYTYYDSLHGIITMNAWQYIGIAYDHQAGKNYSVLTILVITSTLLYKNEFLEHSLC